MVQRAGVCQPQRLPSTLGRFLESSRFQSVLQSASFTLTQPPNAAYLHQLNAQEETIAGTHVHLQDSVAVFYSARL